MYALSGAPDPTLELVANSPGLTVLMLASLCGATAAARALLERGASISLVNCYHRTPLMLAAMSGHEEIVQLLLSVGAAPDGVDVWGRDAATWAEARGYPHIQRLINTANRERRQWMVAQIRGPVSTPISAIVNPGSRPAAYDARAERAERATVARSGGTQKVTSASLYAQSTRATALAHAAAAKATLAPPGVTAGAPVWPPAAAARMGAMGVGVSSPWAKAPNTPEVPISSGSSACGAAQSSQDGVRPTPTCTPATTYVSAAARGGNGNGRTRGAVGGGVLGFVSGRARGGGGVFGLLTPSRAHDQHAKGDKKGGGQSSGGGGGVFGLLTPSRAHDQHAKGDKKGGGQSSGGGGGGGSLGKWLMSSRSRRADVPPVDREMPSWAASPTPARGKRGGAARGFVTDGDDASLLGPPKNLDAGRVAGGKRQLNDEDERSAAAIGREDELAIWQLGVQDGLLPAAQDDDLADDLADVGEAQEVEAILGLPDDPAEAEALLKRELAELDDGDDDDEEGVGGGAATT